MLPLTPCPFCGSTLLLLDAHHPGALEESCITCDDCGARGPLRWHRREAEHAWNARAASSPGMIPV